MFLSYIGRITFLCALCTVLHISSVFAQNKPIEHLSLADTNCIGNLLLFQFDGWQFSFTKPEIIADQKNLINVLPDL